MAGHTDNAILIAAPVTDVWAIANDIPQWPTLFDGDYVSAELLHQTDDVLRFRLTTTPGPDGSSHSWISERFLDPAAGTAVARRVDPGPFHYMHIHQSFTAVGGGTLLRWVQDFDAKPGAPFTNEVMTEHINASSRRNLMQHKDVIEARRGRPAAAAAAEPSVLAPLDHGHIDVRVHADAPLDHVWAVSNDRAAWAHAGHPPVEGADFGSSSVFTVATPPDPQGRSWAFTVHRIRDDERRTVFSRRYGSPEFLYNTVWFGYRREGSGTEMRCVTDFAMADGASATTAEMTRIMETAMTTNLGQIAEIAADPITQGGAR
jgi:aromatase